MEELAQLALRGRLDVVVSGGTGAGKTTFMQAMLAL
jgi:Flp pilus assembly CpaF family ATPase